MNDWNDYLASLSAGTPASEQAPIADFGRVLGPAELAAGFVAPVSALGLIAVRGDDAATFLHGQLTNDVTHLAPGEARLAGYCSPKGRLQATMLMWRDAESVYLQLPRALQPAFQKRLSMFVLRAKARLTDATAEPAHAVVLGLGGAAAQAAVRAHVGTLPAAPNAVVQGAHGTLIRLADAFGAARYLWLMSRDAAARVLPALSDTLVLGGDDAWQLAAIHAGIAQVTPATLDAFVPQMINWELVGGVNFKKGCYPGQEIVARSQYLGKLKRRTTLATIDDPAAAAGADVFAVNDPDQPCGTIVNAAPNGAGGVDALVEMKLAALDQEVHLGSTAGPVLKFHAMPYALDAIEV